MSPQPTLARRALGRGLRRLREAAGMTIPEAAAEIRYSRQTVTRIERGEQPTRTQQVESLCGVYGAPPEQLSYLTALAFASSQRGWWEAHKEGAFPEFRVYAEAEQEAAVIQVFEPEFIPGIAQTEDYVRALQATDPPPSPDQATAIREFRLKRQDLLYARKPAPRIEMVIGMSAIGYLDHDPALRDAQIDKLRRLGQLPGVDVRIAARLHAAMGTAFTVLTPGQDDGPPFAYMDAMDGCRYVEETVVVSHYQRAFVRAREVASPIKEYRYDAR